MTSAEEQFARHTSNLLDAVTSAMHTPPEGNVNLSQIEDQYLEPPESRPCAPDEHEPNWDTLRKTPLDMTTVVIDCENCLYAAYYDLSGVRWEDWEEL